MLDLRNRLEETCDLARKSLQAAQRQQKHYYDKGARDRSFGVGGKCSSAPTHGTDHNKLLVHWKGPYKVVEVVGACDYKVEVKGKVKVYYANLLKKYVERKKEEVEMAAAAIIEAIEDGTSRQVSKGLDTVGGRWCNAGAYCGHHPTGQCVSCGFIRQGDLAPGHDPGSRGVRCGVPREKDS